MEKEGIECYERASDEWFLSLLKGARRGNKSDLEKIINFFQSDILNYTRFMGNSKEDATQILVLELIELVMSHTEQGDLE